MELTAVIDARSCAAGAGPTLTQAVVGPAGADSDCGFHHSRETRWIPDSRAVATQRTFRCSSTAVERSRQLFRLNAIRVLQGASSRRSTCLWLRKCALNPAKSARRARRAEPPADLRRRRRHPTGWIVNQPLIYPVHRLRQPDTPPARASDPGRMGSAAHRPLPRLDERRALPA